MNSNALLSCAQLFCVPTVVHRALLPSAIQSCSSTSLRVRTALVAYTPASSCRRAFAAKAAADMQGQQMRKSPQPEADGEAFREDMETAYGAAYATRSSDEGYGEMYGDAVVKYQTTRSMKKVQHGATAERDQNADAFGGTKAGTEYDTSQGERVAEKEKGRHAKHEDATKTTEGQSGASM